MPLSGAPSASGLRLSSHPGVEDWVGRRSKALDTGAIPLHGTMPGAGITGASHYPDVRRAGSIVAMASIAPRNEWGRARRRRRSLFAGRPFAIGKAQGLGYHIVELLGECPRDRILVALDVLADDRPDRVDMLVDDLSRQVCGRDEIVHQAAQAA